MTANLAAERLVVDLEGVVEGRRQACGGRRGGIQGPLLLRKIAHLPSSKYVGE